VLSGFMCWLDERVKATISVEHLFVEGTLAKDNVATENGNLIYEILTLMEK